MRRLIQKLCFWRSNRRQESAAHLRESADSLRQSTDHLRASVDHLRQTTAQMGESTAHLRQLTERPPKPAARKFSFGDVIQLSILAVLAGTFWAAKGQWEMMTAQYGRMTDQWKLMIEDRRPVIGVFKIEPRIAGFHSLQTDIEKHDELLIDVSIKNAGKSAARIKTAKIKGFYGFFKKGEDGKIVKTEGNMPLLYVVGLSGSAGQKQILLSDDEPVPVDAQDAIARGSLLLPGQEIVHQFMVDALETIANTRAVTTSRESEIVIEVSVHYETVSGEKEYWYRALYTTALPMARHITFQTALIYCDDSPGPPFVTGKALFDTVYRRKHMAEHLKREAQEDAGK